MKFPIYSQLAPKKDGGNQTKNPRSQLAPEFFVSRRPPDWVELHSMIMMGISAMASINPNNGDWHISSHTKHGIQDNTFIVTGVPRLSFKEEIRVLDKSCG